jgi:hypothetical protein
MSSLTPKQSRDVTYQIEIVIGSAMEVMRADPSKLQEANDAHLATQGVHHERRFSSRCSEFAPSP